MSWLRLHEDIVENYKIQSLPLMLFRSWINCLCIAKKYNGLLPDMEEISYKLRITKPRAERVISELIGAGLIDSRDKGVLAMHDWNDWQYSSDISTERVRQHRERFRNVSRNVPDTETDTDTEAETEGNRKSGTSETLLRFGEYGNVRLTADDISDLRTRLNGQCENYIARLDLYGETHPAKFRKYKNHKAVILTWWGRDLKGLAKEDNAKPRQYESDAQAKQRRTNEAAARVLDLISQQASGSIPPGIDG